ncbi:MAG: hypothetical protein KDA60_15965 [Planctomycetales bacterium]|nr:hypothetical protein [Planctomycetales bacterium]
MTRKISSKQIFVIGILMIPTGFIMFMLGQQELRQAAELDAEPEAVLGARISAGGP